MDNSSHNTQSATNEVDLVGTTLDFRYNVLSKLDKGTSGTVYKCLDNSNNSYVAIKAINAKTMQQKNYKLSKA